jgi:hypothetical protein
MPRSNAVLMLPTMAKRSAMKRKMANRLKPRRFHAVTRHRNSASLTTRKITKRRDSGVSGISGSAAVMVFLGQTKLILSKQQQGECQALFFSGLARGGWPETVKA